MIKKSRALSCQKTSKHTQKKTAGYEEKEQCIYQGQKMMNKTAVVNSYLSIVTLNINIELFN